MVKQYCERVLTEVSLMVMCKVYPGSMLGSAFTSRIPISTAGSCPNPPDQEPLNGKRPRSHRSFVVLFVLLVSLFSLFSWLLPAFFSSVKTVLHSIISEKNKVHLKCIVMSSLTSLFKALIERLSNGVNAYYCQMRSPFSLVKNVNYLFPLLKTSYSLSSL